MIMVDHGFWKSITHQALERHLKLTNKVKGELIKDTLTLLNVNPESKHRKLKLIEKEFQERIRNGRQFDKRLQNKKDYGKHELYKQIKYEKENLGDFEKISVLK